MVWFKQFCRIKADYSLNVDNLTQRSAEKWRIVEEYFFIKQSFSCFTLSMGDLACHSVVFAIGPAHERCKHVSSRNHAGDR